MKSGIEINRKKILNNLEGKISSNKSLNIKNFIKLGDSIINKIEKLIKVNSSFNEHTISETEEIIENILLEIIDSEINEKVCYLKVMDYFPSLIWRTGIDSKCNFLNKAWLDFTGCSYDCNTDYEWRNNIHKDDSDEYLRNFSDSFHSKKPFKHEYRLKNHDGKYYNIIDYARPFYNDNGGFEGYIGTCYNITDKIENEKKLQNSNEQLNKLLTAVQQTASTIVITSLEGDIEFVNKKFTEITGYTFDEAIGKNPRILKSDYLSDDVYKKLWETISSGNIWEGEFHNKKKNGELFWEKAIISPVFNNDNKIINYIAIKENITEKKFHESKIKEQEELFIKTMTAAQDAIVLINTDGNVIFWNKMAEKIFGYTATEMDGNNFHNMIVPLKYRDAHNSGFSIFKKTGLGTIIDNTLELTAYNKNGDEFPVELSLSSVMINEVYHAIGIIRDITERKKIMDNLEKLNKTKNQLISIIGHDLRSSFLTINGFSKLLIDRVEKLSKEEISLMSNTINNTSSLAQRLLENIVQWAKSQTNSIAVEITEFNYEYLLNDCININKPSIDAKEITIETNNQINIGIFSDRNILSTVLRNIISNSIKYSHKKSKILIDSSTDKENAIITIKDFGLGFSTDVIEKINSNENIVSTLGTNNEKGTGLGLMLCVSLLNKINGHIEIKSEKDKGSEIKILLPNVTKAKFN